MKKRKGRPRKEVIKKRVSFSIYPSKYSDFQKIAFFQNRSMSEIIDEIIERYNERNAAKLTEYEKLK